MVNSTGHSFLDYVVHYVEGLPLDNPDRQSILEVVELGRNDGRSTSEITNTIMFEYPYIVDATEEKIRQEKALRNGKETE